MYANGRLTPAARDRLLRIYANERKKDSLLVKFERRFAKRKNGLSRSQSVTLRRPASKPPKQRKDMSELDLGGSVEQGLGECVSARSKRPASSRSCRSLQSARSQSARSLRLELSQSFREEAKSQSPQEDRDAKRLDKKIKSMVGELDPYLQEQHAYAMERKHELVDRYRTAQKMNQINWVTLQRFHDACFEAEQGIVDKFMELDKLKYRDTLEEQLKQKGKESEEIKKEKQIEQQEVLKQAKQVLAEEKLRVERARQAVEELRQERQQELDILEKRRQIEELIQYRDDLRRMAQAKREMQEEERKQKLRREKVLQDIRETEESNRLAEKLRAVEERKEVEADRIRAREHEEILEKQDRQRRQRLMDAYRRQERNLSSLITATKTQRELAEEDQRRADAEVARREKEAIEELHLREKKRAEFQQSVNKFVECQLRRKEELKRQSRKEDEEFAEKVRKEAQRERKRAEREGARRLEKMKEQREFLLQQHREHKERAIAQLSEMSLEEKKINRDLIERVLQGTKAVSAHATEFEQREKRRRRWQ